VGSAAGIAGEGERGHHSEPLGGFLGGHPILASLFFCFITLAAPLVGAAAIHHAAPRIHEWLTWKRAKDAHESLHNTLSDAQKKLESEQETLGHQLRQLEAQQENWQANAAQYYEHGRRRGARQDPHWLVILKATVWSLGGLVLGCLLGPFVPVLYFVLPAGVWTVAFLHYRQRRFHPTIDQFHRQGITHFAVSTENRRQWAQPVAPRLLPPQEDDK
jgi:Flp pilus assembly protein TadB